MNMQHVWLIKGASQGLGLALVKHVLAQGQRVVATTRDVSRFAASTGLQHPCLEVISLDLTDEAAVAAAVAQVHNAHGRLDVLVNNAGFGFLGAVEEASPTDITGIFEINVFASLRLVRQVLPYMRASCMGHIFNLSSIGGFLGTPGFGIYNATKFAVEGFSEALAQEVRALGLHVTIVEPGHFRTNFLDHSLAKAAHNISDYAATVGRTKQTSQLRNQQQPGDPALAAAAIYEVATTPNPPLRLLLGPDAYARATQKLADTQAEFIRMQPLTVSTNFAE
jgi:NAD(P)-dependent dehydrogenase (short-subunit alcohol dehydrogenase family)